MRARLLSLSGEVGRHLRQGGRRLATAESCTGGWIAKTVTDVAGSSQWFECGFVTYSNESKQRLLNVRPGTLKRHGAVSERVVREMARGALRSAGADIAVAVSGVAGPGGGTADKPVGLVWFCWAVRRGRRIHTEVLRRRFRGGREQVRAQTVAVALEGVARL